jgi:hypothetical protein
MRVLKVIWIASICDRVIIKWIVLDDVPWVIGLTGIWTLCDDRSGVEQILMLVLYI